MKAILIYKFCVSIETNYLYCLIQVKQFICVAVTIIMPSPTILLNCKTAISDPEHFNRFWNLLLYSQNTIRFIKDIKLLLKLSTLFLSSLNKLLALSFVVDINYFISDIVESMLAKQSAYQRHELLSCDDTEWVERI